MRNRRMLTVFALMLASFLTAVDVTIVDTAMPRIVGSLGGFAMLTWLVSAYMLTSTATMPVYGKLADIIGRKKTFTIGAVIFVTGSALCGAAQSMEALILFLALQGLGAGAMQPTVQTILGDIFSPAERAKVQGWFSTRSWGFSALAGPLVGGLMVDYLTWRYLFYINLPLGALALFMVWRYFDERVERRKARVDYLGAVTLTGGMALLLLVLLTGGSQLPWASPQIVGMSAGAAVLLVLFLWTQVRALDPILPLRLFRIPVIGWGNLSSLMVGGVMYGTSVYLPIWAQGVQGYSATRSGASLLWLSIGWPIAAVLGSRLIVRMGVRPSALLGLALNLAGAAGLVVLARTLEEIPEVLLALVTFVIGAGMGFSTLAFILGIQSAVDWAHRGLATAVVPVHPHPGRHDLGLGDGRRDEHGPAGRLQRIPGVAARTTAEAGQWANRLLDPAERAALGPELQAAMQEALAAALRNVHLVMLLAAFLSLAAALLIPNLRFAPERPQESPAD